jgi:hypothetical protein
MPNLNQAVPNSHPKTLNDYKTSRNRLLLSEPDITYLSHMAVAVAQNFGSVHNFHCNLDLDWYRIDADWTFHWQASLISAAA